MKIRSELIDELVKDYQKPEDILGEGGLLKLLYLSLRNIAKKWTMPIKNWRDALNQFATLFEGRMPLA
ncbi:MAG: hypothetical protein K8I29_04680 [Alphaproteobacteria bacterium]|uniref:Uncharacterized protein n=1 Tax=Candidatus Nitrobium versatile TaxID=2884831 RepID=A0A953J4M2_9BACT|nr:hypothetical protein [Candidatus Nitrobium versatile]